jgi:hypothetical protein
MWNFDDSGDFAFILHFKIPAINTRGDKDKEKRETLRKIAFYT